MHSEPNGPWENGARRHFPTVQMPPTSFRTIRVRDAGSNTPGGDAIRIAGAAPYPQRVVLLNRDPLSIILAATSPNELNFPADPGVVTPGSFGIFSNDTQEFALAPGQALYAAGDGAVVAQFVSVSVSAQIPTPDPVPPPARQEKLGPMPTSFRTYVLNNTGSPSSSIRIVPASRNPQRVVLVAEPLATNVRLSSSSNELETPGIDIPAGAFAFDAASGSMIFVVAPDQPLFATVDAASPTRRLSVSVSEIDPYALRGAIGIPGAGGTE